MQEPELMLVLVCTWSPWRWPRWSRTKAGNPEQRGKEKQACPRAVVLTKIIGGSRSARGTKRKQVDDVDWP